MKPKTAAIVRSALIFLVPVFHLAVASPAATTDLLDGFQNPPDSAKTRTWWHWVSGNVSAEGITADLEAMKRVGVGGAQLFTVDQSDVHGPVKFMSDQWRQLVHRALSEASRLGLEISMEGCDGWSESGGPWITPAQSMQKLVWSERYIKGGGKLALYLPQPQTVKGYYEDIALLAWPTIAGDDLPDPETITTSAGAATSQPVLPATSSKEDQWVRWAYREPITCQSIALNTSGRRNVARWELQKSDDGQKFDDVHAVEMRGTQSFPPVTARYFRLWIPAAAKSPELKVASFRLMGARIDHPDGRTGIAVFVQASRFSTTQASAAAVIDPASVVDLTGKTDWDAPEGNWTIVRIGHTSTGETTHPSTAAGLECDKLSRAAVKFQIQSLYGPVIHDSPDLVGNTFKYFLLDSWECGCENWTPLMRDDFKSRRGYDLWRWLPVLTGRTVESTESTERFLWDYRRTLADLLSDNHYGTFADEAHQNHMELASEASGIGMPTVADQLQCKGRCDIPMGEFWVNKSNEQNIDDPKETASAAHIYGKPIAATESFTATPGSAAWTNDPYSLKAPGDREFCLGINRFVFHRYAHQPWLDRKPGMSMGPWGINFERTNTWWEQGRAWLQYLARCQFLLQQGQFNADLCYFYGEGVPVCVNHAQLTPQPPAGFDYDVCNAEALTSGTTVDDDHRLALPSGMRYRVLVLPNDDRLTLPVMKKIEELVKAGATVYGPKPDRSPSLSGPADADQQIATMANDVWGNCDGKAATEHLYGKGRVAFGQPLEKLLGVPPDFRSTRADQLFIHRHDGGRDIYFVSNQQPESVDAQYSFRVTGKTPELWHPDTGETQTPAIYQTQEGVTTLPIHLDPIGSVFVIFQPGPAGSSPVTAVTLNEQPLPDQPLIVLGKPQLTASRSGNYQITGADGKVIKTEVKLPDPITMTGPWQITFPPKLGAPDKATFDHLMSWTESPDDGIKYFSGTAAYQSDVTIPADSLGPNRRVFLDLGNVKNIAEVSVNGKPLGILWKAPFRTEITSAAQPGINHVEIAVTNLWPNRLIGDLKLPESKRITWTSFSYYKPASPLLQSGLLGPVTVRVEETVTLP